LQAQRQNITKQRQLIGLDPQFHTLSNIQYSVNHSLLLIVDFYELVHSSFFGAPVLALYFHLRCQFPLFVKGIRTVIDNNNVRGCPYKAFAIRGGIVQCGHFADKGDSSDADVRTFWCKTHRIFRNLWRVRTRDVEAVEYFLLPTPLEVSCFRVRFRFLTLGIFASASSSG